MTDVRAVKENVFPGAHDAVWQAFPWHDGAASSHSSQALAVSVFGTLAVHPSCQLLVDEMARVLFGWVPKKKDGEWQIRLEVVLPADLLREPRPTQLDVLLQNKTSAMALECKFTERGGLCSQTQPLSSGKHKGLIQCDGYYRKQQNPVNDKWSRCALSAKKIRYWTYIPKYFDLANDTDHKPCPFAGTAYQYMRNALAAARWARGHKLARAGFGLVYVDGQEFSMSREVAARDSEWNRFVKNLREDTTLTIQAMSYQRILEAWAQCMPQNQVLADLTTWVDEKMQAAQQAASYGAGA